MSYILDKLRPGEEIIYKAAVAKFSYLSAIFTFAVLMEPTSLLRSASTNLALTNKRIIGRTGILGRKTLLLPHAEIGSVRVRRGLLGHILGCGTVTITARDGRAVTFKWIKHPLTLQEKINEAVEMAVLGRRLNLPDDDAPASEAPPLAPPNPRTVLLSPPPAPKDASAPRAAHPIDPEKW